MVMMDITSTKNPRVREWKQLRERKGRRRQNCYLIEGVRLVEAALCSSASVETLVFDGDSGLPDRIQALLRREQQHRLQPEMIGVTAAVLSEVSDTETPQGIAAVVRMPLSSPEWLLSAEKPLVLAADGVQDPGNLGTMIRCADAVGADAVLVGKGCVDIYNPKTVRSTMGSLFHLPVLEADLQEWLPQAAAQGVQIVIAALESSINCYEADLDKASCIVIGNEANGVRPELRAYASPAVRIPMKGAAESLNAAMAATVLLFEAARQRGHTK